MEDLHENEHCPFSWGLTEIPTLKDVLMWNSRRVWEGAGDGSWQKKGAFGKRSRLSVEDVSSWGSFSREFHSPVSKRKGAMRAFFAPSPNAELVSQMVYLAALWGKC